MADIVLTVDLEPDCPPYLEGWRGMRDGAPRILEILAEEDVPATFFATSESAEAFPEVIERLVADGHELGCHGRSHRPFSELSCEEAEEEIRESAAILRRFAPVTSFRAPNLRLPECFLPFLEEHGFLVDASRSRYKPAHWLRPPALSPLRRLVTSTTSSVLRLPPLVRDRVLLSLASPVVLFVHPWEFVDLSAEALRWDCRFNTGEPAADAFREVVGLFKDRGDRFLRAAEAAELPRTEPAGAGA